MLKDRIYRSGVAELPHGVHPPPFPFVREELAAEAAAAASTPAAPQVGTGVRLPKSSAARSVKNHVRLSCVQAATRQVAPELTTHSAHAVFCSLCLIGPLYDTPGTWRYQVPGRKVTWIKPSLPMY